MTVLYIIAYLIIPVLIYSISDYIAGYFHDRLDEDMSIYGGNLEGGIIGAFHIFWPLFSVLVVGVWIYKFFKLYVGPRAGLNMPSTFERGKAKRKKDTDLDYQAEKHLLGKE